METQIQEMDELLTDQQLKQDGCDQIQVILAEILEFNALQDSIKIMLPSQPNEFLNEEIVRGLDQKNETMEVLLVPMDAALTVPPLLLDGSVQEGPLHLQMYALNEQLDSIQTVKPIQQPESLNEEMDSGQAQKCEMMETQEVEMDVMLGELK